MQNAYATGQEDFGCLDIHIEVPRQSQLDLINKNLKFHAHQVATLDRSLRVGQLYMNDLHTEQVLEGFTRILKHFGMDLITLGRGLPLGVLLFDQPLDSLQDKINRQMPLYILKRFMREERPLAQDEEAKGTNADQQDGSIGDPADDSPRRRHEKSDEAFANVINKP